MLEWLWEWLFSEYMEDLELDFLDFKNEDKKYYTKLKKAGL